MHQLKPLKSFLLAAQLAEPSGLHVLRVHVNLALFKRPDQALAQESKQKRRGGGRERVPDQVLSFE